jgi:hypothetical protein
VRRGTNRVPPRHSRSTASPRPAASPHALTDLCADPVLRNAERKARATKKPSKETPSADDSKKQTKLKPKITPKEILVTDPLFLSPAVGDPLSKKNAGGRFVLAPTSIYPDEAQPESGGWVTKIIKVDGNDVAHVKFHDQKTPVKLEWSVVASFKTFS